MNENLKSICYVKIEKDMLISPDFCIVQSVLYFWRNPEGKCVMNFAQLQNRTKISNKDSICFALKMLQENGYINIANLTDKVVLTEKNIDTELKKAASKRSIDLGFVINQKAYDLKKQYVTFTIEEWNKLITCNSQAKMTYIFLIIKQHINMKDENPHWSISIRKIADESGYSSGTIASVIEELEKIGLLYINHGEHIAKEKNECNTFYLLPQENLKAKGKMKNEEDNIIPMKIGNNPMEEREVANE